jgi:hypothetical protein
MVSEAVDTGGPIPWFEHLGDRGGTKNTETRRDVMKRQATRRVR